MVTELKHWMYWSLSGEHPQLFHTTPQLLILISEQLALPQNKSLSPSLLVSSAQHRLCSENWTSATRECKYHQLGLGKEVADPLDISGLIIWHDSSRFLLLVSQASLKEEDSDEGLGATTFSRQGKKAIWSRCTRTCKFVFYGELSDLFFLVLPAFVTVHCSWLSNWSKREEPEIWNSRFTVLPW